MLPIDPLLTSYHRATHYGSPVDTSQVPTTSSSTIYHRVKTLERYRCRKLILKYWNQEISALRNLLVAQRIIAASSCLLLRVLRSNITY